MSEILYDAMSGRTAPITFTPKQLWAAHEAQKNACHAAAQGDATHEQVIYAGIVAVVKSLGLAYV